MFPVAPNLSEMNDSYMKFIEKKVGEPKLLIEWPKIWRKRSLTRLDSPRNIKYMRKFALCWPDYEIVQRVVAQIAQIS